MNCEVKEWKRLSKLSVKWKNEWKCETLILHLYILRGTYVISCISGCGFEFRVRIWVIPNLHPKYRVLTESKPKPNQLGFHPLIRVRVWVNPAGLGLAAIPNKRCTMHHLTDLCTIALAFNCLYWSIKSFIYVLYPKKIIYVNVNKINDFATTKNIS
jgi:hypothetical protein